MEPVPKPIYGKPGIISCKHELPSRTCLYMTGDVFCIQNLQIGFMLYAVCMLCAGRYKKLGQGRELGKRGNQNDPAYSTLYAVT